MKYKEIDTLLSEEIKEKIVIELENLRKLKFAHAISPIENPMKIKKVRRFIARLKTAKTAKKV